MIIGRQENVPSPNGNIAVYTEMRVGQPVNCEEFTYPKYEFENACKFVALQLLLDWNRQPPLANQSPILKQDVVAVGVSMLGHPKTLNLTQVLYVKGFLNPPVPVMVVQPQLTPMVAVVEPPRPSFFGRLKLHLKSA